MMKLQGIFPALTSSFDYQGKLYKAKVFHNIEKLNRIALGGYLVCGSTGETPLLSVSERLQLMAWVREACAEDRTLIAGVGAESVDETVHIANAAASLGFDAALALTPFYYRNQMHRPDTQALYFRAVADRSKIPVLIYNIPQVTGYDVPVDVVAELSEHPNILGMKDSSGNLERMKQVCESVTQRFHVLSGSGLNFPQALKMGARGAILAIANALPYACVTIWEAFRTREQEAVEDWQARITPPGKLIAAKHGIPGLKYAMDLNGYYGGNPRLPILPLTGQQKTEVERLMEKIKN